MPSEQISDSIGFEHPSRTSSGRPSSALDHINDSFKWGNRPRSTPAHSHRRHGSAMSGQNPKMSRPKTAAVILGRSDCNRVQQLEHEPTRRHNLESHLGMKKAKPPPWQKNLETPLVPFVVGPGYILSRSKTKCHVTIKDEFFDPIFEENNRKKSQGDPERDSLIAQLQQQIADLTLYLEEERLNHKQTKQKAEEYLRDKVEQMTSQHQDHIRELEADHKDEMHRQKTQMEEDHKESQAALEKQISRMVKEIEFLQGAFESYKSTLHTETTDKWRAREEALRQGHAEDKQHALQELKTQLTTEMQKKFAEQKKIFQKTLDTTKKEGKREMDGLVRRFANAAADMERLKKTTAELEETQADLQQLTETYTETCVKLTNTTRSLTDAKVKLMEFEEKFQEKVNQVDEKYRGKLQELMTQNTELKRLFVQKCGELFDEKTHTDIQTSQRVTNVKETMESLIKSKQRANMSIALGGGDIAKVRDGKTRPLSAPGTRSETHTAHGTAGEARRPGEGPGGKTKEFIPPEINLEADPDTEEMRAGLMAGGPVVEVSKEELIRAMTEL